MNKYEKILETCLKKQFSIVGEKFSWNYVKQKNWFWEHTWTVGQEQHFKKWMIDYLRKNGFTKRSAEKEVVWFVLDYGWKTAK